MSYRILFLILFTLEALYRLTLNIVQFKSAANPVPANVADVYDAETYARWRAYHGEKSRLAIWKTAAMWVLTMILLLCGFHAWAANLFPRTLFWSLTAVVLAQAVAEALLSVGFAWADTMRIEQKYGFNRSTVKTFVMDRVRNLLVEVVLSLGLTGLLAFFHLKTGDWLVLLLTGAMFLLTLTVSLLYGPVFSRSG